MIGQPTERVDLDAVIDEVQAELAVRGSRRSRCLPPSHGRGM
ncbi:hypothetical protein NJ7G_3732 [Natrinema sp. J7-2]|nr:hypothetical protein NJ7G_3732 [Natrinema sp. J7-2]